MDTSRLSKPLPVTVHFSVLLILISLRLSFGPLGVAELIDGRAYQRIVETTARTFDNIEPGIGRDTLIRHNLAEIKRRKVVLVAVSIFGVLLYVASFGLLYFDSRLSLRSRKTVGLAFVAITVLIVIWGRTL